MKLLPVTFITDVICQFQKVFIAFTVIILDVSVPSDPVLVVKSILIFDFGVVFFRNSEGHVKLELSNGQFLLVSEFI